MPSPTTTIFFLVGQAAFFSRPFPPFPPSTSTTDVSVCESVIPHNLSPNSTSQSNPYRPRLKRSVNLNALRQQIRLHSTIQQPRSRRHNYQKQRGRKVRDEDVDSKISASGHRIITHLVSSDLCRPPRRPQAWIYPAASPAQVPGEAGRTTHLRRLVVRPYRASQHPRFHAPCLAQHCSVSVRVEYVHAIEPRTQWARSR